MTRRLREQLTDDDMTSLHAATELETSDNLAESIVRYASTHGVDVIVLGTHGRGAMAQLFVGSVAERVVRTAPCPVLTVRHPEREFLVPDQASRLLLLHRRRACCRLRRAGLWGLPLPATEWHSEHF